MRRDDLLEAATLFATVMDLRPRPPEHQLAAFLARVLFDGNALNRHFQDVHAIRQHHANGMEKPSENFGAVQFGKKNTDFFI